MKKFVAKAFLYLARVFKGLSKRMKGLADAFDMVTGDVTMPLGGDEANTASSTQPHQSQRLAYAGSITTDPQENLDFQAFFKDRDGLYIWGDFVGNVLRYVTETVKNIGSIQADFFDLRKDSSDHEVRGDLPVHHEFGLIEGLALIVWLLLKQWNGEEGSLLINGRANIFYIKIVGNKFLGVSVFRNDRKWHVDVWRLGEVELWYVDLRVFSRNGRLEV